MGRLKRATAILDNAERWKQRCLLDGESLFTEERLWTRERFGQLHTCYVERPDEGPDPFEEKLRRQLNPAPPEAKRLWAEITWAAEPASWDSRHGCREACLEVDESIPEGCRSGHRGKLNPHDTNAEALAVAADWRGRSVGDPVRLRPEFLYRFRPYAVLPARDGLRTRLRLARRHPADARPGAAASGFPAGYIRVRGRTLSTLGGRRHHRRSVRTARHLDLRRDRLAPGMAGAAVAPAVARPPSGGVGRQRARRGRAFVI